jgi:hypothetical protein
VLFNNQRAVSSRGRINSYPKSCCTAAYDEKIPRFLCVLDSIQYFVAFHRVTSDRLARKNHALEKMMRLLRARKL